MNLIAALLLGGVFFLYSIPTFYAAASSKTMGTVNYMVE